MKRILFALAFLLLGSGCAKINPRIDPKMDQKIDNQNGRIEDLRNNQNGVMAEIGKLRQEFAVQNSQLKEIQQGMLNINAAVSRNENSGVQVLQGDGPLVLIFGIATIGMILWHYRSRAIQGERAAQIMAAEVARHNNPELNDGILRAALNTEVEGHIFHLLSKNVHEQNT